MIKKIRSFFTDLATYRVAMSMCLLVPFWLIVKYAQTVRVSGFQHEITYFRDIIKFLNLEGHQNCKIGSKVTPILEVGFYK